LTEWRNYGNKGTEAAIAAIKMASLFVDASKSNGPLLSAGAMQLEEGSRTKGIKLKTNYIFSVVKKTYPFILVFFY
jgi:hypothetical protein